MSYIRKSVATFINQIFLIFFGMATGIIVARVLGPELKGKASLIINLSQLLFMFGSLGLGSAFSFFIAKKRYPDREIITFALIASLTLGTTLNGVFFLSWPLHSTIWQGVPFYLVVCSTIIAVIYIFNLYSTRILVGFGEIYSMNAADFIKSLINFLAVVALVLFYKYGLLGVVTALFLAALAQSFTLLWFLKDKLAPVSFWRSGLIRDSLNYGLKSHSLLLINFLNYRLDIFLLKYFSDDIAVGYYSLAVGMAELMWVVPNSVVPPLFSNVAQSDADDRSVITLRTCRWSLIFLAVLAMGGVLLGRQFISLLYGAPYLQSYEPFLWLLPGICLFPLFKLLIIDLAARGFPGYGTIASAVALVVNIGANILLIPRFGGIGAAMATSLSYILMAIISLVFFLRFTRHSFRDVFIVDHVEVQFISTKIRQIMMR